MSTTPESGRPPNPSHPPRPAGGPPATGPLALHAPWRLSYMDMLKKQEAGRLAGESGGAAAPPAARGASTFLREYWLDPSCDERNHVIVRTGTEETGRGGLIMLNRYPYANGHLLVSLGAASPRLLHYSDEQRAELWSLVDLAVLLCERTLEPQGVNVGINQGEAAGAGVPAHLHVHVVPRWHGDVNFISVVGQVRVIPSALEAMAARYREEWQAMGA